jgi:hypothetical protein
MAQWDHHLDGSQRTHLHHSAGQSPTVSRSLPAHRRITHCHNCGTTARRSRRDDAQTPPHPRTRPGLPHQCRTRTQRRPRRRTQPSAAVLTRLLTYRDVARSPVWVVRRARNCWLAMLTHDDFALSGDLWLTANMTTATVDRRWREAGHAIPRSERPAQQRLIPRNNYVQREGNSMCYTTFRAVSLS